MTQKDFLYDIRCKPVMRKFAKLLPRFLPKKKANVMSRSRITKYNYDFS